MRVRTDPRLFWRLAVAFWVLEIIEFILAIIILGITASASIGFLHDLDSPDTPGKLKYNIAIAAITLISLIAFIVLDLLWRGLWKRLNYTWSPWLRVLLNAFFVGFWIGAVASSFYTCSDLCNAGKVNFGWIRYATLCCDCSTQTFSDICHTRRAIGGIEQRTGRYEATQGLDILLMLVFLVSTTLLVAFHWVRDREDSRDRLRYLGELASSAEPTAG